MRYDPLIGNVLKATNSVFLDRIGDLYKKQIGLMFVSPFVDIKYIFPSNSSQ